MARLIRVTSVVSNLYGELPIQEGQTTFTPSYREREDMPAENPIYSGFNEKQAFAQIETILNAQPGTDLQALGEMVNDTITVTTSDGQVYMMNDAYCTTGATLNNGAIKYTIKSNYSQKIS